MSTWAAPRRPSSSPTTVLAARTSPSAISVLLALKAAVDFGLDPRSHDQLRTWDAGFVDD